MRSIWKGALSFGLVNIPVKLYAASHEKEISFTLLHKKDFSEVRYARVCKAEEKEVPWDEIVKGYEYEDGNFVVLKDEDFEKANLKKTKTIEIIGFIHEEEIDSSFYVRPYFLEPEKNAQNAYSLLREALMKSKKVGLAKFVLRNKEHIAAVKVHDDLIILNEMRYLNELIRPSEMEIPEIKKSSPKELEMAMKLIEHLTIPFNPKEYKDTYTEEIKAIIKQKAKGKPIHVKEEKAVSPKIHDIMSLLKESLETKKPVKKRPKIA